MKTSLTLSLASVVLSTALYNSPAHSQPPVAPQETEVESLRHKVAQQEKRIKYLEETASGVGAGGNALRAPFGRFLLVKDGTHCLALQITEHADFTKGLQAKSKYRWWLQSDGTLDFNKPNVTQGQGVLCEYRNGKDTGEDFIRAGHFKLMWSLGDWIYFSDAAHAAKPDNTTRKDMEMAVTELVRPQDILPHSKTLRWFSVQKLARKTALG